MKDLIEALTIFMKYKNAFAPTHCSNDQLAVVGITYDEVSHADSLRLHELSFAWDEEDEARISYRFDSA